MQIFFFSLSMLLTLMFFVYGFNHYFLLISSREYKKPILRDLPDDLPGISVHLPIYNERYVIRRLIDACAAMAKTYGPEKVNIKILDDSTDDTSLEIDKIVTEYKTKRLNIEVLRREKRDGFKAGALQAALERTAEAFIAVFDADFIPTPDFLLRTVPYLMQDEHFGIVQSRWTHLNRDYNLLTKAIAIGIDVHFLVEQTGRFAAGVFQNFNGSGGVLRKSAILEAGGWQADTLAEDLDLSYRMQNFGYKILFLKDLLVPGELPLSVPSYKKQQGRWACGSLRTARKVLPGIVHNPRLGLKLRLQAFIHLTGYFLHPLMLFSFLLICSVTLLQINNVDGSNANPVQAMSIGQMISNLSVAEIIQDVGWDFLLVAIIICAIAPWLSMVVSLRTQGLSIPKNVLSLLIAFLLGFGVSLSNSIEAAKALLSNRVWGFARTPKYANLQQEKDWTLKKYQVPLDFTWVLELALVCLGAISIRSAIKNLNYGPLLALVPYTSAYLFVFSLSVLQSRRERSV